MQKGAFYDLTHQIWRKAEPSELPHTALGRFGFLLSSGVRLRKQNQLKLNERGKIDLFFVLFDQILLCDPVVKKMIVFLSIYFTSS